MKHAMRRNYLVRSVLAGALVVLAVGAPAVGQDRRLDGVTLRVATWGGSWRDAVHELIGQELEKRGAKLEYVLGNPRDNLGKLIAARGREAPFDVMEIDDPVKVQLLEGQLLEPLNYGVLPNAKDLPARLSDRFTVGSWVAEEGIVYNVKKFEEQGIPKPQRASDLFHPKLAGRVSFPDINVGMAINGIVGFAIDAGSDESNIDPGLELIKKLKVASFYKSSVELATKFNSGDVWAAWWHAGWALRVRKAGVPVAVAFPQVKGKEGMMQLGWLGVPKGGKVREAADAFINRYLDSDVQAKLTKKLGVAPAQPAALAQLVNDPELKDLMLLTSAQMQNMYFIDWSKVNPAEWVNKWNRTMAR